MPHAQLTTNERYVITHLHNSGVSNAEIARRLNRHRATIGRELARRRSFSQLVEIIFAIVVTVTLKEFALPLLFGYFVFAPPVNQLRRGTTAWIRRSPPEPSVVAPTAEDG